MNRMTDKIGCLIFDLQGTEVLPEEREMLQHPLVGGVILFKQNYESREQLTRLCHAIHASREQPLLIMVDQEGGRVQRFINDFSRLPFMAAFGTLFDNNPESGCRMAKDCGWLMAIELLSAGVDLSLAPVLDLNKGISSVIGKRAFHSDPQSVIQLATAFINGMNEAGMAATGKHFPGHGSVTLDSHVAMPVDEREIGEIEREDMIPFAGMIKAGVAGVMAAHIIFPAVDHLAVGYSKRWLKDILRSQLGFGGAIFSDDLNMEGANISANHADRVIAAREAGCDFTLLCNNRQGVIKVLDTLPAKMHLLAREKWARLQATFTGIGEAYKNSNRWMEAHKFLKMLEDQAISNLS